MARPPADARWSGPCRIVGVFSRGSRYVREHLDEVQKLRSERGMPLIDPADPKTKERYGL